MTPGTQFDNNLIKNIQLYPLKSYGKMDDEELTALYLYLKSLPPEVVQK